jgi:hypothetical protein
VDDDSAAVRIEDAERAGRERHAGGRRAQGPATVAGNLDVDEIAQVERVVAVRAWVAVRAGIEMPTGGGALRRAIAHLVDMHAVPALVQHGVRPVDAERDIHHLHALVRGPLVQEGIT